MNVNFGNVAESYARYRNDLPAELLEGVKRRGIVLQGKKAADLGAGTGVLSRALYKEGAAVVGVEPSKELLAEAKEIDSKEGAASTILMPMPKQPLYPTMPLIL